MTRPSFRPFLALLAASLLVTAALGCGLKDDEEAGGPYTCPADAPTMACPAGATIESTMDIDAQLASDAGVTEFAGPLAELLCATWEASGRPLRKTPRLQLLSDEEFTAARDTHEVFRGRDVPGFIVHDPGAPEGARECIVMPNTWPAVEFVEVVQHEVGHVLQSKKGEAEAELAEIVQALTTAQIHPRFGARLLEAIFDIKVGFEPNVVGHAHALMTLANNGGDFAAAHAGLKEWSDAQGLADLKTACGCDDPLADSQYAGFATPFVDAIAGFTPVSAAAAGEDLLGMQAFLRWRLAFALNEIHGGGDDFMPVVDATADYISGRDAPGLYHSLVTRLATQILAAAATPAASTPPETPVRLGHWKRIIELNAVYPTQDGEADAVRFDQYLRAYSAAAGWASAAASPDAEIVRFMSDTFLARHGESPTPVCEKQVAAEVFQRRAGLEFGGAIGACAAEDDDCKKAAACASEPWFERSQALLGWSAEDDCAVAMEGITEFVQGELAKVVTFGCDG